MHEVWNDIKLFFVVNTKYQFDLNGNGDYPYYNMGGIYVREFILLFWFKTAEQNVSYFLHLIPNKPSSAGRLTVWRQRNTFFVELWKDYVWVIENILYNIIIYLSLFSTRRIYSCEPKIH